MKVTCDSGDHSKSQLTKILEKPLQAHLGEKVITTREVSPLKSLFPAPSQVSEETPGPLGGPPPGDIHRPSEVPLTGQEDKPPSQAPTYNFVDRIWHSEYVVEADKGSLEPSPHPAMARNE